MRGLHTKQAGTVYPNGSLNVATDRQAGLRTGTLRKPGHAGIGVPPVVGAVAEPWPGLEPVVVDAP